MLNYSNSPKIILFLLILLWCIGLAFPLLKLFGIANPLLELFLSHSYGNVCHQQQEKLVVVFGVKLFVCWRCAGIYFGALEASFISIFYSKEIRITNSLFAASAVPMIIDVALYSSRIYSYNNWIAFSTGIILSTISLIYILQAFENQIKNKRFT